MRVAPIGRSQALILILILFPLLTSAALAAGSPSAWNAFQADTRRSEEAQLAPDVQARYQAWFLRRVEAFMTILGPTAVGKAVTLGDMARIRARFTPPAGSGDWTIVWRDRGGLGPTKEPGQPFYFPTDAAQGGFLYFEPDSSNVEMMATCWHEVQHGFLAEASLSAPGFHAADQEHFYIESVAQNTVEWLHWLTIRLQFETRVREAAAAMAEYQRRGEPVTYAAERHLWAQAHVAWRRAWDKTRSPKKGIVTPDATLAAEYERLAGVRMPAVEDVIRFYMTGGVKDPAGKGIQVPEWVMVSDPVQAVVLIDKSPGSEQRTPPERGGELRHSFEIRVSEITRPPNRHTWIRRPVDRGKVTVRLDTDDDDALVAVQLEGKRLPGLPGPGGPSNRMIQVSLAAHPALRQKSAPLRVVFVHGRPNTIRGKRSYRIRVTYEDEPPAGGERVYQSSEAVYWIDVTGAAKPAASATGSPSSSRSGSSITTTTPATSSDRTPAGRWVLTRHWTTQYHTTHRPSYGFNLQPGNGRAQTAISIPDRNGPITTTFHFTWDPPPAEIPWYSQDDPPQEITATITGIDWPRLNVGTVAAVMQFYSGFRYDKAPEATLISHRDFRGAPEVTQRKVKAGSAKLPSTQTFKWTFPNPLGDPAKSTQVLTVRMVGTVTGGATVIHAHYEYTWKPGSGPATAPAATEEVTSVLRDEPQPEPRPEPTLDNTPPEKGEVIPVVPVKPTPPVKPPKTTRRQPAGRWYIHPTGDWRVPLPADFTATGEQVEGADLILKRDESLAVMCQRQPVALEPGTEGQVLEKLVAGMRRRDRRAAIEQVELGGRPAVFFTYRDDENKRLIREVHLFGRGRAYLIMVMLEPGRTDAGLLVPVEEMLRGLRFGK